MNSPFSVSRNSDRSYDATLPQRPAVLPPTHHRVIAGVEMGRDSVPTEDDLFAGAVRHFNMVARHVSAQAITLTPLASAELEGALHLACGSGGVDIHQCIPSITSGRSFRVVRRADLFDGGTLSVLNPGVYTAGDTIVDRAHGRVYLELHHGERDTSVAVIGLFKEGRLPVCVDWRVTESAS
jgi:hypothetical protein